MHFLATIHQLLGWIIFQSTGFFNWVENNPGQAIAVLGFIGGLIATFVRTQMAASEVKEVKSDLELIREALNAHEGDRAIHRDPERDEKRWQELRADIADFKTDTKRSLDKIEQKIDRLPKT